VFFIKILIICQYHSVNFIRTFLPDNFQRDVHSLKLSKMSIWLSRTSRYEISQRTSKRTSRSQQASTAGRCLQKDFRIENLKAPVALSKAANARSFITALCSSNLRNNSLLVMGFCFCCSFRICLNVASLSATSEGWRGGVSGRLLKTRPNRPLEYHLVHMLPCLECEVVLLV
jgi:hypothetical protein